MLTRKKLADPAADGKVDILHFMSRLSDLEMEALTSQGETDKGGLPSNYKGMSQLIGLIAFSSLAPFPIEQTFLGNSESIMSTYILLMILDTYQQPRPRNIDDLLERTRYNPFFLIAPKTLLTSAFILPMPLSGNSAPGF